MQCDELNKKVIIFTLFDVRRKTPLTLWSSLQEQWKISLHAMIPISPFPCLDVIHEKANIFSSSFFYLQITICSTPFLRDFSLFYLPFTLVGGFHQKPRTEILLTIWRALKKNSRETAGTELRIIRISWESWLKECNIELIERKRMNDSNQKESNCFKTFCLFWKFLLGQSRSAFHLHSSQKFPER